MMICIFPRATGCQEPVLRINPTWARLAIEGL